jgi:hypothetical protein
MKMIPVDEKVTLKSTAVLLSAFLIFASIGRSDDSSRSGMRNSKEGKVVAGFTIKAKGPGGNWFLGSEGCIPCHESEYKGWQKTFHSTAVQDARANPGAILADFNQGDLPFTRDEVEYTIGSHWDQRYMKEIEGEYYVLPRLWSVQSKEWRPYSVWSWKRKPYSKYCAGCHTTYIDPVNRTIGDEGVGCEACHGPGGRHAENGGDAGEIVNPSNLSIEKYNMICASCHVRGTDKTESYYYPIGFVPGDDLTKYYVPLEMKPGEEIRGALSRLYRDWKDKKVNSARARCEVCGIGGTDRPDYEEKKNDVLDFCFSCHNFRTKMQLHTHHPNNVTQVCTDCHIPKAKSLKDNLDGDIHSYSYFMVHNENCYDKEIEKACVVCHKDEKDGLVWARDVIKGWKKPIYVDH